ncbi:MAG: hypothetical protein JWR61_2940 [Ferruginibacter sp.]|nr:hypothetical protein [Ferruginibacter sp.]
MLTWCYSKSNSHFLVHTLSINYESLNTTLTMLQLTTLNKPRVFLFSILAILSLYVLVVQEVLYLWSAGAAELARYKSMSWILVPHGISGMIALVTGPFQFSTTLRRTNLALHKKLGKIYIIAILSAMPFAILLNIYHPIPGASGTFAFENITQATVWAITAAMAWLAASKRQITIHKMWAARSYGVTLVFVLSRIYNPLQLFMKHPDINDFGHFLWFLLVFALVAPDMLVFSKELFTSRKTHSK